MLFYYLLCFMLTTGQVTCNRILSSGTKTKNFIENIYVQFNITYLVLFSCRYEWR